MSESIKLKKCMRGIAPKPYELTPEERVEAFDILMAVANVLTKDPRLLVLYEWEILDWLCMK